MRPIAATVILLTVLLAAGCDHGFVPPDEPVTGSIVAEVTYSGHPSSWPPMAELEQLLFVAMRFVPRDTTDFLHLGRMVISDPLATNVSSDRVVIRDVLIGSYVYSGVAQKYGPGTFDWRPVGVVEENGGIFIVAPSDTTYVSVTVDFSNPPLFPPPTVD